MLCTTPRVRRGEKGGREPMGSLHGRPAAPGVSMFTDILSSSVFSGPHTCWLPTHVCVFVIVSLVTTRVSVV